MTAGRSQLHVEQAKVAHVPRLVGTGSSSGVGAGDGGDDGSTPDAEGGATSRVGEGGAASVVILWMPYTAFSLLLLCLMLVSFARFHRKHGHKYRQRRRLDQICQGFGVAGEGENIDGGVGGSGGGGGVASGDPFQSFLPLTVTGAPVIASTSDFPAQISASMSTSAFPAVERLYQKAINANDATVGCYRSTRFRKTGDHHVTDHVTNTKVDRMPLSLSPRSRRATGETSRKTPTLTADLTGITILDGVHSCDGETMTSSRAMTTASHLTMKSSWLPPPSSSADAAAADNCGGFHHSTSSLRRPVSVRQTALRQHQEKKTVGHSCYHQRALPRSSRDDHIRQGELVPPPPSFISDEYCQHVSPRPRGRLFSRRDGGSAVVCVESLRITEPISPAIAASRCRRRKCRHHR